MISAILIPLVLIEVAVPELPELEELALLPELDELPELPELPVLPESPVLPDSPNVVSIGAEFDPDCDIESNIWNKDIIIVIICVIALIMLCMPASVPPDEGDGIP